MVKWQSGVDAWFRTHHGVASADTLAALGMSSSTMHRWVRQERLVRVFPGVFRTTQWPDDPESFAAAACASHPEVSIAFTTAVKFWRARRARDNGFHVLVPHDCVLELPGIVVHRSRLIEPVDIVERRDGIRLTSPPRTLFDSADMLGFSATRSVMEQFLHEGMCTLGTIIDTFSRLAHPRRPGTLTMAEVIASRPPWRKALQSDLELRVFEEIDRQGLPQPIAQCPVALPTGATIHLDFGWPEWKVGLEVDDPAWHAGVEERHRDAHRDRKAATVRVGRPTGLEDRRRGWPPRGDRRRRDHPPSPYHGRVAPPPWVDGVPDPATSAPMGARDVKNGRTSTLG